MFGKTIVPLKRDDNKQFFYYKSKLKKLMEETQAFISENPYCRTKSFGEDAIIPEAIKYNNAIECSDIEITKIQQILSNQNTLPSENRQIVLNLFEGYKYFLSGRKITKDSLRELYNILSNGLLDEFSTSTMGQYYRTKEVYVLYKGDISTGIHSSRIDECMSIFLDYLNKGNKSLTDIEQYIKSQILQLYMIYSQPYYDVNSRTGRTLSMWYLYNHNDSFGLIFNRGINFDKEEYLKMVYKARKSGNLTQFLKYMLETLLRELEKDYILTNIKANCGYSLNKEEILVLEYFLALRGEKTINNLALFLNHYDPHINLDETKLNLIFPLMEKGIFLIRPELTQKGEQVLIINPSLLSLTEPKVKNLAIKYKI